MPSLYTTSTLLEVTRNIREITPFYLNFFPRVITFDTEDIFFDKVDEDYRRLAPLVVPNVQGQLLGVGGYTSLSFKPAYVKPKHAIDPNMVIERRAGEALATGSLSLQQRKDASLAQILKLHRVLLTNRFEWLASKALIDAQVTLAGDNYPTTTVNFQRHASLSYTLAGAARWSEVTGDPLLNIRNARINANQRSGATIRRVVFGGEAWALFTARVSLKDLMDKQYGGYSVNTNVQRMSDGFDGQEYMGTFGGSFGGGQIDVWVDTSKYVDEAGVEQFFLPQKQVVGFSDVEGVRCFGAIKDFDAGLQPMEMYQKSWRNEDPSAEFVLTQSAPLMVPKRPNASFKIITTDV